MPFPTYDDAVDVAQLQAAVAEMLNQRVKSGSTVVTTDATPASVNVTFGVPFGSTPQVTLTPSNVDFGTARTGVTATGFTLIVKRASGSGSAACAVSWIATDLGNA